MWKTVGAGFLVRRSRRCGEGGSRPGVALSLSLLIATTVAARAEDWPQFRGPTGQGHSIESGLALEWSETRNVVWKTPVPGDGWSSPVVGGGRVWMTTAIDSGPARGPVSSSLRVLAFDVATGKELINVEVFRLRSAGYINPKNSRASPTPILEGERVYVHFGAEGTAALTTSGKIVWKTQLPYESEHGAGGSPALFADLLIVSCDGNAGEAFVAALDKDTGKIRWKTQRRKPSHQAYSTPLAIRVGDHDQIVSTGAHRAAAYDPRTGREIWRVGYPNGFSNVPRPVYGHGLVYIATGFNDPTLIAVRPDGEGDVTRTHIAWTVARGVPLTPSPILVGDHLYMVSDIGILTCLDARTGMTVWQARLPGDYSASPVFADGRIYFQSEDGLTTVIAPGKQFRRLATNRLDGAMQASMAVSDGSIFIRTDGRLYRIQQVGS